MREINVKYFLGNENLKPVVFIHGDLQNHTVFQKVEELMQGFGHTTLSFDLPGHGLSKITSQNKDLMSLLEKIITENNLESPIFMGHSSGGTLAVGYAIRESRISGLVLANSPFFSPEYSNPEIDWKNLYGKFMELSHSTFQRQELVDYMSLENLTDEVIRKVGLKTTNFSGLDNNFKFYIDLPENQKLFQLEIPILFIVSNNDTAVKFEYARAGVERMYNGRLITLENGGHNFHITKPNLMVEILRENYSFVFGQNA